jgi:hypothetical protein
MPDTMLVFSLHFSYWDDPPGSDGTSIIAKPTLEAFADAAVAAASNEGLSIVEGDLWFFLADGSPLEAVFSEQPYVDTKRLRYFAGAYSLQPGHGKTLREIIAERCPPIPQIIVRSAPSDEAARRHGWSSVGELKSKVEKALEAAIPDLSGDLEWLGD